MACQAQLDVLVDLSIEVTEIDLEAINRCCPGRGRSFRVFVESCAQCESRTDPAIAPRSLEQLEREPTTIRPSCAKSVD
jgi:hypothetical protein